MLYVQFSDCGKHMRRWSHEAFDGATAFIAVDGLTETARNLERYPFTSATMMEAGQLAANAIRNATKVPA